MAATLYPFTAVAIAGRALMIAGPPGCGKSSLALMLIDRGAVLIGDDGVGLAAEAGALIATPPPPTQGLIEIRGVGLITLPVSPPVPAALLLRLDATAPRFIEAPPREVIAGVALPVVTLWPEGAALALRAEWALAKHGLQYGLSGRGG